MSAISYSADYPSPIQELRERAYVNKAETERYDVKNWVNSVCQLYQQVPKKPICKSEISRFIYF